MCLIMFGMLVGAVKHFLIVTSYLFLIFIEFLIRLTLINILEQLYRNSEHSSTFRTLTWQ